MYIYKVYCQSLYYLAWLATTRMEFKEVVEVISSQSVSSEIFKRVTSRFHFEQLSQISYFVFSQYPLITTNNT